MRNYLDLVSSFEAIITPPQSSHDCKKIAIKSQIVGFLAVDIDNPNTLFNRKIILLSLALIMHLRWCTVEIEKGIISILKTVNFRIFLKI